ncbi:hypothetical protein [Bradyrhizobium sp. BR 1432]|uniref:hypothetical protein n=1 Tax=Bradyrhizobium sp. BR 1432 TaxID=3447966 RepID=UPI003EE57AC5
MTEHIRACEKVIAQFDRPTDAFPLEAVIVLFVVNEAQLPGWEDRVDDRVWNRVARLTDHCFLCPYAEQDLQNQYFALNHQELVNFRRGVPIVKIVSAIDTRTILSSGGRMKQDVEVKIRKALAYEVFRRDVVVGQLQAAQDRLDGKLVVTERGSGLPYLSEHAWVEGVQCKGDARKEQIGSFARKLAVMSSLRAEGESVATEFVAGAAEPKVVVDLIVKQAAASTANMQKREQYDAALAAEAWSIKILMKACARISELSKDKVELSTATHRADQRIVKREEKERKRAEEFASGERKRERWRALDPIPDPMTKTMHQEFTRHDFSPEELVFVAATAGVDPNLLCIAHVLATPEFRLAQMLRKMNLREEYLAGPLELGVLRELFGFSDPDGCYQEARSLLISLALQGFSQDWWVAQLKGE